MKTLTFLGSVFLPGTYLASFFDMGFFNFEAGESSPLLPFSPKKKEKGKSHGPPTQTTKELTERKKTKVKSSPPGSGSTSPSQFR